MAAMKHMRARSGDHPDGDIIFVRLHPGDEVHASLQELARLERIPSASVSGIGAVNQIVLALFEPSTRRYLETAFQEDLEIVSMTGTLGWLGDAPATHLHAVVSRADCTTAGGHIMRAIVSVTLEITLIVGDLRLERRPDPDFGLNLLALE